MARVDFLARAAQRWATATRRGRALVIGAVLVAALLVAGLISSARQAQRERSAPAPDTAPVSVLLPALSRPPGQLWSVPEDRRDALLAPVGGDAATVLYTVREAPGSARASALAVFDAATGAPRGTVGLGGPFDDVACLVAGAHAACSVSGAGETAVVFTALDAAARPVREPTAGRAVGYPVGTDFLFTAAGSAPTLYRPDGSVAWRAEGTSFLVTPGSPVLYALDKREGADGAGRVLAAADGHELMRIAVKVGQQVRYAAFGGGFALERPGDEIRFFATDATPYPRGVSAQGGQRLAAAGEGPVTPVPVLLEQRDDGVAVVGVDVAVGRNLWRRDLPQRDPSAIRVSGSGRQVIVDDGAGRCYAFAAQTGAGGAVDCGAVLGTDGTVLALARGAGAVEAVRPGEPAPLWRREADAPAVYDGALYARTGRLL